MSEIGNELTPVSGQTSPRPKDDQCVFPLTPDVQIVDKETGTVTMFCMENENSEYIITPISSHDSNQCAKRDRPTSALQPSQTIREAPLDELQDISDMNCEFSSVKRGRTDLSSDEDTSEFQVVNGKKRNKICCQTIDLKITLCIVLLLV